MYRMLFFVFLATFALNNQSQAQELVGELNATIVEENNVVIDGSLYAQPADEIAYLMHYVTNDGDYFTDVALVNSDGTFSGLLQNPSNILGSTEIFGVAVAPGGEILEFGVFSIGLNGKIVQLTTQTPTPPNAANCGLTMNTNEKWLRDKVLGVTSQDNPKIYRTQDGKGLGDFIVVRFGKAVVIEVKTPTGGQAVNDATTSPGTGDQIKPAEFPHAVANTCATMIAPGTGVIVTLPTNPDNDDWQTIWNKIKMLTPAP